LGIIIRQAVISTVFSYLGAILGFLNVSLLMNRLFTIEQFGLREALLSIAVIAATFSSLGSASSLVRFFPFFNREGKNDGGLLSISIIISFFGFLITAIILLLIQNTVIETYIGRTTLFKEYFWVLFPLTFLLLMNLVLEGYIKARARTALTTFVKEVFHRFLITIILVLFYYELIDFRLFIVVFLCAYFLTLVIYVIHLQLEGELFAKIDFRYFPNKMRKVYFNYSFFSILSGFSNLLIAKVDILMVGYFLGGVGLAIYANAVYLSVLIFIPAVAITKIASPIIARAFKLKRIDEIEVIYKKSSTTQFLAGGMAFILLWSNLDNFFEFQRIEYRQGKMVLFFLGLSRVLTMMFGVAGSIINISRYYRFDTITSVTLAIFTVISNAIMIPLWGLEGGAISTMFSLTLFYLIRAQFVRFKFDIHPFSIQTVQVAIILVSAFGIAEILPYAFNIYFDTLYRSIILVLYVGFFTLYLNISEDINRLYKKVLAKVDFRSN
jgi:O-antigen/teichoic acid export membrane protein